MRLITLPLLIISFSALAQVDTGTGADGACNGAIPSFVNGGIFNCATLDINAPLNFNPGAAPLIVKVQGNVSITNVVTADGGPGFNNTYLNGTAGGISGPGASRGGGEDPGGNLEYNLILNSTLSPSFGKAAPGGSFGCEDGGGGGGFKTAGKPGTACSGNGLGAGGSAVSSSDFSFGGNFRGGFGGGAGGNSFNGVYGAGGGGGGAIRIVAGGDIFISGLGRIFAIGGAGGPGGPDGGGGGGGSGGVIWLQSLGNIQNDGMIRVTGGAAGEAPGGGIGPGRGGAGSDGFIRFEDMDGIPTGTGTAPGAEIKPILSRSSSSLKSSISCGSVKPNDDSHSAFMQLIVGFFIALSFGMISKKRLKLFA